MTEPQRMCMRAMLTLSLFAGAVASRVEAQDPPRGVALGFKWNATMGLARVVILPIGMPGGDSIRAIVARDLGFGGRIEVVDMGDVAPTGQMINYQLYNQKGVVALVEVVASQAGARVTMHEVAVSRVAGSIEVPLIGALNTPEWRMSVHGLSDDVEEIVTTHRGVAQTRILYVTLTGKGDAIRMVDSDGANDREVVSPRTLAGAAIFMSPTWHPSGTKFAFTAMMGDAHQIYEYDFTTRRARALTSVQSGTFGSPVYSPDGTMLAYAFTRSDTQIFLLPQAGGPARQLTMGGTSNMYPSFNTDGKRIAFSSKRTGADELYIMNLDGTNVEKLTELAGTLRGERMGTDWSPRNLVAYHAKIDGEYQVLTVDPTKKTSSQRTSEGENSDPSWGGDGRHMVVMSTRSREQQLWIIDNDAGHSRQLTHGGARLPAWSPPLRGSR